MIGRGDVLRLRPSLPTERRWKLVSFLEGVAPTCAKSVGCHAFRRGESLGELTMRSGDGRKAEGLAAPGGGTRSVLGG